MMRFVLAAAAAIGLLAGCASGQGHGRTPHDPPDYRGVPTDDRPPSMIDTAPAGAAAPR